MKLISIDDIPSPTPTVHFTGHVVAVKCTLWLSDGRLKISRIPLILTCRSDDTGMMSSYHVSLCDATLEQWRLWESLADQKKDYLKAELWMKYHSELCAHEPPAEERMYRIE